MDQKSPEAFRTISEVADWLGVPTHVLRFWESRFSQVKPVKRAGGRRYYRPADMELLGGIRKLLHEDGMTIRGVQKLLREQGVKHVASLSQPLDAGPDLRDVTPGNVVALSDRREAARSEAVEEAEIVEEAAAEDTEERRFPFDDEPVAATPEAQEDSAEADEAPEPTEMAAEVEAEAPGELAETAPADGAFAPEPPAATEPERAQAPEIDVTDPLPAPETMDFLAHEAEPEHVAPDDTAAVAPTEAPASAAAPDETEATDPMSSPDALSFAAHGAEPELVEETPQTAAAEPEAFVPQDGEAVEETEAEDAGETGAAVELAPQHVAEAEPEPAAEPAAEAEPDASGEAPAPALVMPAIDDDPDDDDREAGALIAADLRGLRGAQVAAEIATLQALADRLDEIQRRFGARDHTPGSL